MRFVIIDTINGDISYPVGGQRLKTSGLAFCPSTVYTCISPKYPTMTNIVLSFVKTGKLSDIQKTLVVCR